MKKFFLTLSILAVTTSGFFSFLAIPVAHADIDPLDINYGGLNVLQIPCTCTGDESLYVVFPFYSEENDYKVSVGFITASDFYFSEYAVYYMTMGSWVLGDYSEPADTCAIGFDPYCIDVPADGSPTTRLGISLPDY